jgi:hypothetical protein
MKDSHFRTPRTMSEACWQPEGQAIFTDSNVTERYSYTVALVVLVIMLAVAGVYALVK